MTLYDDHSYYADEYCTDGRVGKMSATYSECQTDIRYNEYYDSITGYTYQDESAIRIGFSHPMLQLTLFALLDTEQVPITRTNGIEKRFHRGLHLALVFIDPIIDQQLPDNAVTNPTNSTTVAIVPVVENHFNRNNDRLLGKKGRERNYLRHRRNQAMLLSAISLPLYLPRRAGNCQRLERPLRRATTSLNTTRTIITLIVARTTYLRIPTLTAYTPSRVVTIRCTPQGKLNTPKVVNTGLVTRLRSPTSTVVRIKSHRPRIRTIKHIYRTRTRTSTKRLTFNRTRKFIRKRIRT
ncbi:uncharacterized protein LOC143152563 [Ptiloglossa arizonensis]|uniref:uncharacterized protein LOC143152563 n=1 Tax=Ptiloglossa arizonensis TaxID=3350558 RepID=UPI003FA07BAB